MLGWLVALLLVLFCAKYFLSTPVYWFHLKSCPHCVAMEDEWSKFEAKCMLSLIRPIAIESSLPENQKITDEFGVSSFPTIIKMVDGTPKEYSGPRTAVAMYEWASA